MRFSFVLLLVLAACGGDSITAPEHKIKVAPAVKPPIINSPCERMTDSSCAVAITPRP